MCVVDMNGNTSLFSMKTCFYKANHATDTEPNDSYSAVDHDMIQEGKMVFMSEGEDIETY